MGVTGLHNRQVSMQECLFKAIYKLEVWKNWITWFLFVECFWQDCNANGSVLII